MKTTFPNELNLGLMGGMFDPVHNGHLDTATTICEQLGLDALSLLPCGNPVHRENHLAEARHRLAMLALAAEENQLIRIDDRECRTDAPSYTVNSLRDIRRENPAATLLYIMGMDTFNTLSSWYEWKDIFGLVHIIIACRPGFELAMPSGLEVECRSRIAEKPEELEDRQSGMILITRFELLDISSSQVRENIRKGEEITSLVPRKIADYIHMNGLYTQETVT